MSYWDEKVAREQIDKKLNILRDFESTGTPKQGWVKTIREALRLSAKQLAKKSGLDQPRISRIEAAEKSGDLKLSSMHKIASGLNMKFVYGFVSEQTLEQIVREQAKKVARKRIERLSNTMRLEKQQLSDEEQKKAFEDLVNRILIEQPKDFWDH